MKFSLIDDCLEEIVRSHINAEIVKTRHQNMRSGFWPSLASIKFQEVEDGVTFNVVEGQCLRKSFYEMAGYPATNMPDPGIQDVWDVGSAIEEIYKVRFKNLDGYRVLWPNALNQKLRFQNPVTKVRGEADLVLQHKPSSEIFGVEIKSYYGFWAALDLVGFEKASKAYTGHPYIRKDNALRQTQPFPKVANLLQTALYLDEFKEDIKLWKLIYIARDKGPTVEFDITLEDQAGETYVAVNGNLVSWLKLSSIYDRFAELEDYLSKNYIPPRDFIPEYDPIQAAHDATLGLIPQNLLKRIKDKTKSGNVHRDWQCEYCPHLMRCLSDAEGTAII